MARTLSLLPGANGQYLLEQYRHIELNPVRARRVQEPSEYDWWSYPCNALGIKTDLIPLYPAYLAIVQEDNLRLSTYRELFTHYITTKLNDDIRKATNKGLALGNDQFKVEIEALSGRCIIAGKRGRSTGWRKNPQNQRDQAKTARIPLTDLII